MQFDMTFPALPCEWISLDAMDISGDMHLDVVSTHLGEVLMHLVKVELISSASKFVAVDARFCLLSAPGVACPLSCIWLKSSAVQPACTRLQPFASPFGVLQDHDVKKRRLDSSGKPLHHEGESHRVGPEEDDTLLHTDQQGDNSTCGSCYGANSTPEQCCNTCEEVRACPHPPMSCVWKRPGMPACQPPQFAPAVLALRTCQPDFLTQTWARMLLLTGPIWSNACSSWQHLWLQKVSVMRELAYSRHTSF